MCSYTVACNILCLPSPVLSDMREASCGCMYVCMYVCVYECVCVCVCVFGQYVGSLAREVLYICDQITGAGVFGYNLFSWCDNMTVRLFVYFLGKGYG